MTSRAAVKPTLNRWVGELLGPPGHTRIAVVDEYGADVAEVSLASLNVQPIDLLAILASGLDDGLTELTVRVLDTLRPVDVRENEPAPALRLELARHAEWPWTSARWPRRRRCWRWRPFGRPGPGRDAHGLPTRRTVTATSPAADVAELAGRVGTAVSALRASGSPCSGCSATARTATRRAVRGRGRLRGGKGERLPGRRRAGAAPGPAGRVVDPAPWFPLGAVDRARLRHHRRTPADPMGLPRPGGHAMARGGGDGAHRGRRPVGGARMRRARRPARRGGIVAGRGAASSRRPCRSCRGIVIANPTELAAALTAQAVADPAVVADRWLAGVAPYGSSPR